MIVTVTGHRNIKSNETNIKGINQLIDFALKKNVTEFLVGMARGADLLFAEQLIARNLKWTAIIPCHNHIKLWNYADKQRFDKIISKTENQIILSPYYESHVMIERNLWMLERSQLCIGIYDELEKGGTAFTINTALNKNLFVCYFNPNNHQFITIKPSQFNLF
ncbi:SLOG family protein [Geminocystis sp. GBBB08]|uniref:SLOG family protein n=1 Tax=Geminocystis sp. GBBB08 TaxID=2604140 RepID=UPI0027E2F480|nr:SLOG family protein [Geminocystis sp. GBBB08]MBL1208271.1 DUF1273 domain-containing protein [Geminocystis sp. GBBB08]